MKKTIKTFLFLLGMISLVAGASNSAVAQMSEKEKAEQIKKKC